MKLFTKILLIFLACVIFSTTLSVIMTNLFLKAKFAEYIGKGQKNTEERIIKMLTSFYEKEGKFFPKQEYIGYFCMMMNSCVKVEDLNGKKILKYCTHSDAEEGQYSTVLPLKVKNKLIGKVFINHMHRSIFSFEDMVFKRTINLSIIIAGVFSCLLAFILSLIFSHFFLKPVREISRVSKKIAEGDLSQRVKIFTRDEIGELGKTLNYMVENLQKLETLRKRLTTEMAHEIKTPISIIQSHLEAVKDGVMKMDEEKIDELYEEVERLSKLVNNFYDLSLAESGSLKVNKIQVNLGDFIEDIQSKIKPLYKKKGISISAHKTGDIPLVNIDSELMERVFFSILHNAYKFTSSGGKVEIFIENSGKEVLVRIMDTGTGISPEDLPYVFERFFRSPESSLKGGIGIGLHIARELVSAQGGKIDIKSEKGSGTEVIISIPI